MQLRDIVIDCRHAPSLARFWADALDDYEIEDVDDDESEPGVLVEGPGPSLYFQQVPEPKAGKNRMHIDLVGGPREAEVARLERMGARVLQVYDEWTVMQDPEGNEFCVLEP